MVAMLGARSQFPQQTQDVRRFDQRVIMIRQHALREGLAGVGGEHGQQVAREIVHATGAVAVVKNCRRRREESHSLSKPEAADEV